MRLTDPHLYKMSIIAANLERCNSDLGRMGIRMIVIPNINMEVVGLWILRDQLPDSSFPFCRWRQRYTGVRCFLTNVLCPVCSWHGLHTHVSPFHFQQWVLVLGFLLPHLHTDWHICGEQKTRGVIPPRVSMMRQLHACSIHFRFYVLWSFSYSVKKKKNCDMWSVVWHGCKCP